MDTAELLRINYKCAIFIVPDDKQLAEIKKDYTEEEFEAMVDDISFYNSEASHLLDSFKIRKIHTSKHYIRLIGKYNSWTLNTRPEGMPGWHLVFFNGENRAPRIMAPVNVTAIGVRSYFNAAAPI